MTEASAEMRFERAAKLRDEIKALRTLAQRAAKGEHGVLCERRARANLDE